MTRQVLGKSNNKADEGARLAYYTLPPPHGIAGVHPDRLVDIDETGVWLAVCRRKLGHVPRGEKGETHAPYSVGKKYTVTLAIDTGGVVAYLISDAPGTTSEMWYAFLQGSLLPNLPVPGRVLLYDNLSAHGNAGAGALIEGSGHQSVKRPKYSCDLGSIEFANNVFKTELRSHWYDLTEDNLVDHVEDAIQTLTAEQCEGFFRHTGHFEGFE
jgi:transposase